MNAESVEKAKKSVAEGKSIIQQRQKKLKLADSSELGWKVVSEYQSNPLASDSEDERKIYKAEVRAERKARKDQQKRLRLKRSSFRGIGVSKIDENRCKQRLASLPWCWAYR